MFSILSMYDTLVEHFIVITSTKDAFNRTVLLEFFFFSSFPLFSFLIYFFFFISCSFAFLYLSDTRTYSYLHSSTRLIESLSLPFSLFSLCFLDIYPILSIPAHLSFICYTAHYFSSNSILSHFYCPKSKTRHMISSNLKEI